MNFFIWLELFVWPVKYRPPYCQHTFQKINYRFSFFHCTFLTVIFLFCSLINITRALCPSRCRCDDTSLSADCTDSGLDVLPITLNPQLARLQLAGNHIRSIQQTLSFYNGLHLLDLSANHLQTLGQRNLAQLQKLQQLLLDRNRLHRIEQNSFAGLQRLRQLSLSGNQLGELSGRAFTDLNQLQRLSLSQNHLAQLHSEWSVGLHSLLFLNLSSNQLPSGAQLAAGWSHLPALVELDLSHNPLHFLTPDTFISLHQLRTLHLQNCLLQHIHESAFRPLRSLLHLIISENPLTRIPSEAMQPLSQLRSLRAISLKMNSLERNDLAPLKSLTFLELGQEQLLERLDDNLFQSNLELRTFVLEDCPLLSRLPVDLLSNNSQLHELRLRNNAIRYFPQPQSFPPRLRIVLLSGNPLHCDCSLWWVVQSNLEPTLPQLTQQTQLSQNHILSEKFDLMQAESTNLLSNQLLPLTDFSSPRDQLSEDDEWSNHISSMSNPTKHFSSRSRSSSLLTEQFDGERTESYNRIEPVYRRSSHLNTNLLTQSSKSKLSPSASVSLFSSSPTTSPAFLHAVCASPPALKGRLVRSLPADLLQCPQSHLSLSQSNQLGSSKQHIPNSIGLLDSVLKFLPSVGNVFLFLSVLLLFTIGILFCARFSRHFNICGCRWWLFHYCSAKRRRANRLQPPSHLQQAVGQRHSIASSGGGSMKPLCGSNTINAESKCLFAPGSFDSGPPRYSKLRLLPLSNEPPMYETASNQFSPDNHDYEQVRYYDAIGPSRTLLSSNHNRLYENPIHNFESLRKSGRLAGHSLPLPHSLQPFSGGHLV